MSAHVIPYDSGLVALVADLHSDAHHRAGLDPIRAGGLAGLPWTHLDALIVVGDLANDPYSNWRLALRRLATWIHPSRIYVLPGNHDYYRFGIDGDGDLRRLAAAEGVHFIQKNELIHGETRYLCATLWTDFNLFGDPIAAMQEARRGLNDYAKISMPAFEPARETDENRSQRRVSITPDVVLQLHHNHRGWLVDQLQRPFAGRTVVVTHHCPHPVVAGEFDALSPAFSSNLEGLIQQHQPAYWIYGHTHRRLTATVGRTVLRNTSVGNPWEFRGPDEVPLPQLCLLEPADE